MHEHRFSEIIVSAECCEILDELFRKVEKVLVSWESEGGINSLGLLSTECILGNGNDESIEDLAVEIEFAHELNEIEHSD